MGFGQGLSGLKAAGQNLDVIGNNIANSGTVGFKAASVQFADVYASSRVGLGVNVSAINQRFSVGNISAGGEYDMAISGNVGFFRMTDTSGNVLYTRNGQFTVDKNNFIVNAQGYNLTGYPPGGVGQDPIPLTIPSNNIEPQATVNTTTTSNLNANAEVIDPAINPFDPTKADSFTNSTPMSVYDSLGNSHTLTQYFVKREGVGTESIYEVYYTLDGAAMAPTTSTGGATPVWGGGTELRFDTAGRLISPAAGSVPVSFASPGGVDSPAEPLAITMNYNLTQFGSGFTANVIQDGFSSGEFSGISVGKDGDILAKYTNGKTASIGVIALANFNNLQGLRPEGNNAWSETAESGQAMLGQPGSNGLSTITGMAVEESNVDMSTELVSMIIAQRTYQANSQTIKTQDEILQVLMNLR